MSDGLDAAIHSLFDLDIGDAVEPAHRGVLHAFRNVVPEIRDVRDASDRVDRQRGGDVERSPGTRRLDHDLDGPTSARVVTPTEDFDLYPSADPPQEREKDARKIVESAEQEIMAAAKLARRELKAYAADLAVSLAKNQIRVDPSTDQGLMRSFTEQLSSNYSDGDRPKAGKG